MTNKIRTDKYGNKWEILKDETYRGYTISFEKEVGYSLNRVFVKGIKSENLPKINHYGIKNNYNKKDTFDSVKDAIDFVLDGEKSYKTGILKSGKEYWREIYKRKFKNIEGIKAEITYDEYNHYLNILPPLYSKGGFYVPEPITGGLMSFLTKKGNKYFIEVKDKWKDRNAELTEEEYIRRNE